MNRIFSVLGVFFFCSNAYASEFCKNVLPVGAALFQQFDFGTEAVCLYEVSSTPDKATLSFYSINKVGSELISLNSELVTVEDARNGVGIHDISKLEDGRYQILWNYPNGVDAIEVRLLKTGLYFHSAAKEIRLPSFENGSEVRSLTLINLSNNDMALAFDKVVLSEVFNKNILRFEAGAIKMVAKISADKAVLYSEPSESSKTKGYLVKRDEVEVMEYKYGYLKVAYQMKDGKKLVRWIDLSSII